MKGLKQDQDTGELYSSFALYILKEAYLKVFEVETCLSEEKTHEKCL